MLTATVNADLAPQTVVRDADTRLGQYLESFERWRAWQASVGHVDVVVVENSGFDLRAAVRERLGIQQWNFVQYRASDDEHRAGKGVGEAGIVDRVAEACDGFADYSAIHKSTGRLSVRNLGQLPVHARSDLWVQCRISKNLAEVDTRYFRCSPRFWTEYLHALGPEIREADGVFFEHVFAQRSLRAVLDGGSLEAFARTPMITGRSGSTGVEYGWVRAFAVDQLNAISGRLVARQYI